MTVSIQQKLFLLLSGVTIVVLVVVLWAVNSTASSTITEGVISDFKQTQGFFQIQQRLRYDRLVESAYLIQENSTFKANVELDDAPSADQAVKQLAKFIKADLFVVTNTSGKVLSWFGNPAKTGANLSLTRSTVKNALEGEEPPLNVLWPDLWAVEDMLYQIVTVPIYSRNSIIGTITLGKELSTADATELMQNTPLHVVFFLNNEPIAASNGSTLPDYGSFLESYKPLIDSTLTYRMISEPFTHNLNGTDSFSFISPLGKGENAFYVASVPMAEELAILSKIQRNILIIAIIGVIIIIPIAIFLGRILSGPINRLTYAMAKVEKGQLDVSVTPSSNDEIGRMTKSFNNMVQGLKERFALQKYVGSHTLNMIKNNTSQDVKMGGSSEELAILFSDIRNSTVAIERENPEAFIKELNKCLSAQSEIVTQYGGSIDKYVGDSMIALFGGENALEEALSTAIDIQKKFIKNPDIHGFFDGVGIGVNYGSVVLGNMGGNERMDYTVIGPEVNLCARLCGVAKAGQILMPQYLTENGTFKKGFAFKVSGDRNLKGFSKEVEVVEVNYA